jgi:DNA-binding IclR family transcriptional regulator
VWLAHSADPPVAPVSATPIAAKSCLIHFHQQMAGINEKSVPSVRRALGIFEMLASSKKGLTLSQIARTAGVARSSAFYILNTLEECGYVHRKSSRGRYTFTSKLFDLANRSMIGLGLREHAAPFLRRLAQHTGLTAHLAVISQDELVLIDRVAPAASQQLPTWIGKRLPIHCTGTGKALMAYMPDEQLRHHFQQGFVRYNENTIVSTAKLREELARIRANGYAYDDEEETIGLRCIGAAILGEGGFAVAAVSVAGTTAQINDETREMLSREVMGTAGSISTSLHGTS